MQIIKTFAFCTAVALAFTVPATHAAGFNHLKGNPDLHSASALVIDAQGKVIYGKDVDAVRPIASITKLMTAMVVLDSALGLDEKITVTEADRDHQKMTGSRLAIGATLTRRQMIQLAIMSSENRAASALGRNYPGGLKEFVAQMNKKAVELNMHHSRFTDPAGLNALNTSTASDLGKMIAAADEYPLIRQASTTKTMEVRPFANRGPLVYNNTNRLLKNNTWDIALSKTGYINEAGRCLVMRAVIAGEPVAIVLLNSFGKLTPYGDSNRLRKWMLAQG
ncbi:MAG TPA: D-alanyl-D-alanine endopeptidase [Xanthomonadales bacterium]|nr:D-alanyl-D-alanine endopeptidase [Xanthomonadales bacterium]